MPLIQYPPPVPPTLQMHHRIFLGVKSGMDDSTSCLWHLLDTKLTQFFDHRFLQDRSWQLYRHTNAPCQHTTTMLHATACHRGYKPSVSKLARPPDGSGLVSTSGYAPRHTYPTSMTPPPSSKYLHTAPALASWNQAAAVTRNVFTTTTFAQLVRYFPQWGVSTPEWTTWDASTFAYAGNLTTTNAKTLHPVWPPHSPLPHYPPPQAFIQGYAWTSFHF